ncbi:MAG: DUF3105 domain-containing protein [Chloroflexi bacterium]|nr:DUF3105 domain-containing protein [Chloroflexota bacterium]
MTIVFLGLIPLQIFVLQNFFDRPPGTAIENVDSELIEDIDSPHEPYSSIPPTSGAHVASGAAWGVHSDPIPNEVQVANLLDGGVIVQYNCVAGTAECDELVNALTAVYERYPGAKIILAPGPAIADARVALTALNRLEKMKSYRERPVVDFIEGHLDITAE